MILNDSYIVKTTRNFNRELAKIIKYFKYNLKEPSLSNRFYNTIVQEISFLSFMPERFVQIKFPNKESKNIRKLLVENYILIYEIHKDTGQVFILHIFHSNQYYLNLL